MSKRFNLYYKKAINAIFCERGNIALLSLFFLLAAEEEDNIALENGSEVTKPLWHIFAKDFYSRITIILKNINFNIEIISEHSDINF